MSGLLIEENRQSKVERRLYFMQCLKEYLGAFLYTSWTHAYVATVIGYITNR